MSINPTIAVIIFLTSRIREYVLRDYLKLRNVKKIDTDLNFLAISYIHEYKKFKNEY